MLDPTLMHMHQTIMTKLALITGASRGLGASIALHLATTHHIIAVATTTGALEELDDKIKELNGSATLAPMDITTDAAMATLCRGIFERWGKIDFWIHAAIYAAPLAPANMIDPKDLSKSINTNVTATATLISYLAPLLGYEGTAVFFDDPRAGQPFFGSYGATKAAQIALVKSWQNESKKTGPKVCIERPSPMPTSTRARFFPGEDRSTLSDPKIEAKKILKKFDL